MIAETDAPAQAPRIVPDIEDELWDEIQDETAKAHAKSAYHKGRIDGLKSALELVRKQQGPA